MKPTVLIVEDNFFLAADLAELVQEDLKSEPVLARTVKEGHQAVQNNLAIAFLDIELPDGMSYPVARKLVEIGVPVVFISGNDRASVPEDLRNVPFLRKPVVLRHLIILAKALSERLSGDAVVH